MPNYKAHLVGGVVSFGLVLWVTSLIPVLAVPLDSLVWAFSLTLLGSIFPDIDIPSKMQRIFLMSSTGGILAALLSHNTRFFSFLAVTVLFVSFLTHRTITHKPLFLAGLGLVPTLAVCYFSQNHTFLAFGLYLYFTVGCLSHILLDRLQTRIKRLLGQKRRF